MGAILQQTMQLAPPKEKKSASERTNLSSSTQQTDEELVRRVVEQNDEQAFQLIYQRYASAILRRLYRLLSDASLAEDALQQVFLEAYRSLSQFRAEGTLQSWLHRIAGRMAQRIFHRQWRSRSLLERLGWFNKQPLPDLMARQETGYLQHEVKQWVRQCVDRLTPEHRVVVLLCDLEGETTDEVAEQLGLPRGTVASRLFHARKKIRKMVEHELRHQGLSWGEIIHDL